mmetsp:Transcript_33066/g.76188  ORF Transcript_33066/g.76188 Transcript_33066/m.76188 type:complete len:155 (-) Transcript_33066:523-987(-)
MDIAEERVESKWNEIQAYLSTFRRSLEDKAKDDDHNHDDNKTNIIFPMEDPPFRLDRKDFSSLLKQYRRPFSRSAMDFMQLLVEDFHFSVVLEIPIQTKQDDVDDAVLRYKGTSWMLVGPHGSLALRTEYTNGDDDDDDDSEYVAMELEESRTP